MRLFLGLTSLVGLLAGCGTTASAPSGWQRFDALGGRLSVVTKDSSALANDVESIRVALSHASTSGVRRWTARSRRDAVRLEVNAGAAGNQVRALASSAPGKSTQRRYLALVLDTLQQQWIEGQRMVILSNLLWRDPLLMSPGNARIALSLQRQAVARSRIAVADVDGANSLRKHDSKDFRYVPVRLAGAGQSSGS